MDTSLKATYDRSHSLRFTPIEFDKRESQISEFTRSSNLNFESPTPDLTTPHSPLKTQSRVYSPSESHNNETTLHMVQRQITFTADSNRRETQEEDSSKASAYTFRFNLKVFLEYFIYHVFYFIIGPGIIILTPITGYTVLYNQKFVGLNIPTTQQLIFYFPFVTFLTLFYLLEDPGIYMVEVYMGLTVAVIRCITIASKYAHSSQNFLEMMKTKKLSDQEIKEQIMLRKWAYQKDDTIEEELQSTILALEIDISLFHFEFLGEAPKGHELVMLKGQRPDKARQASKDIVLLNPKRIAIVAPTVDLIKTKEESIEESSKKKSKDKNDKGNRKDEEAGNNQFVSATTEMIKTTFERRFLKKKTRFDDNKFYGYNYAFHVLQKGRDSKNRPLTQIVLAISFVHALLPFFCRAIEGLPFFSTAPYLAVPLFFSNFVLFFLNTRIIINTVKDLEIRVYLLKEMGDLISPKKMSHYYNREKEYACLNFCDPITLKTWSNMRKILLHYGDKFIHRNGLNITITMIFYCIILLILILQILGLTPLFNEAGTYFLIFTYESVVHFGILIILIYYGAFINDQYRVHKNFLKQVKTIVGDLKRLACAYFGDDAVEAEGYFHRESIKLLKMKLGGGEDFDEKLQERTEKLMEMIDDIMEELDFEEVNNSFKVVGITMSFGILKSVFAALFSLAFALGQKYFMSS